MADLVLSEDSMQFQELAREFSQGEIAPSAHDLDKSGNFPDKILAKAWEVGLINVTLPEQLGGLGLSHLDACVIAEEISAGCAGVGAAFWGNDLAVAPLLVAEKTASSANPWIMSLVENQQLAGYCFVDNTADERLTYSQVADGFVLEGSCSAINANCQSWLLARATSGGDTTLFVVPTSSTGVTVGERLLGLGLKAADFRRVKFDKVRLSSEHVVGAVGAGAELSRKSAGLLAPLLAAHALGIARQALENAVAYSKERHTMGVPIGKHQAVGLMLADIAKSVESARFMVRKSAWLADNGQLDIEQALMTKTFTFEAAMKAAEDAVQVYGGYGYSREYPVEKLMRDAKTMQLYAYAGLSDRIALGKQLVAAAQ